MTVSELKIVSLIGDRLFTMVSSGKLSYETFYEIELYLCWAFEIHKKKLAGGPGENLEREQNNYYNNAVLSGDELSPALKRFFALTILNPAKLQVDKNAFIKSRVWKIPAKKSEKEIIRRVMRNLEKIESI